MKLPVKVQLFREANRIERCHMVPHQRPYPVGHHSQDVSGLVILTWMEHHGELPRAEVIAAAIFHDTPERLVGDIPSQVKKSGVVSRNVINHHEESVHNAMGTDYELTDEEAQWIYWCDVLELLLWAYEETMQQGNYAAQQLLSDVEGWASKQDWPQVFTDVWSRYRDGKALRLTESLTELDA